MTDQPMAPRLIRADGKEFPLTDAFLIGRAPECTVQIDNSNVSRQHARLELVGDKTILKDLKSRNGTWVNERRVEGPVELHDGDSIRIHNIRFTFRAAAKPGTPGTPGTATWESPVLLTLVRSDNGAETGLNRTITAGRDPKSEIALTGDSSVSQAHARFELANGQVILRDLNSRNGTWVNGVRITNPVYLKHGDKIRIGNIAFRMREGSRPLPAVDTAPRGRSCWLAGFGLLLAGGTLLAIALAGISIVPQLIQPASTFTSALPPTDVRGLIATEQALAEQNALRALVLVSIRTDEVEYTGSGSLLDPRGYVLTNFHVIGNPGTGELHSAGEIIRIGINWNHPEEEPNTYYLCEIVKADADYDLALLHVTALSSGDPLPGELTFPFLPVGDSDNLRIGDPIAVLGYPALGGKTPTFTRGTVSGFLSDNTIHMDRGWIKTDAEINRGNSGGMAINSKGELIGVPTQAAFDLEVTGKISDIRPIKLAQAFIEAIP